MINADTAKARLEAQLIELKERHDRIGKDLAEPLSPDFSDKQPKCRMTLRSNGKPRSLLVRSLP